MCCLTFLRCQRFAVRDGNFLLLFSFERRPAGERPSTSEERYTKNACPSNDRTGDGASADFVDTRSN